MPDLDLATINQKLDLILTLLQGKKPAKPMSQSDEQWLLELKQNQAYAHINFDVELGKMNAWLELPNNKGRKLTRPFILNWLGKIPVPVQVQVKPTVNHPVMMRKVEQRPKGEPCPPDAAAKISKFLGRDFSFGGGS